MIEEGYTHLPDFVVIMVERIRLILIIFILYQISFMQE